MPIPALNPVLDFMIVLPVPVVFGSALGPAAGFAACSCLSPMELMKRAHISSGGARASWSGFPRSSFLGKGAVFPWPKGSTKDSYTLGRKRPEQSALAIALPFTPSFMALGHLRLAGRPQNR